MSARRVLFVLSTMLACRPHTRPDAPLDEWTRTDVPDRGNPSPPAARIEAGRGVVLRPGATVWLDAAGKRPLVLPEQLPQYGIAMRVVGDHGKLLELEVDTQAPCSSLILDDFALRLFAGPEALGLATAVEFEDKTDDGRRLAIRAGAPVEGVPDNYFLASVRSEVNVLVPDSNVARDFEVRDSYGCIEILGGDEPYEVGFDPDALQAVHDAFVSSDERGRVGAGAPVYWSDGTAAGSVVRVHDFRGPTTKAGTRTCFPLPLAERQFLTLCFDEGDVRDDLPPDEAPGANSRSGSSERENQPSNPLPRVRTCKPVVEGKVDKEIVRRVVRVHVQEVAHCYNVALADDAGARGDFTVRFRIDATGSVVAAETVTTSVKSDKLAPCILKAVNRWTFPEPDDGRDAVVTCLLTFDVK